MIHVSSFNKMSEALDTYFWGSKGSLKNCLSHLEFPKE